MLPVRKIVAPTDFSDASVYSIREAARLAEHFGAELIVVNIIEPVSVPPDLDYGVDSPVYEPGLYKNSQERLEEILEQEIPSEVQVRSVLRYGEAAREVCRIAQEESANLIVLSTHGLTGWRHLVFGSVAEKIVRFACCPVLTLRAPK